MSTGRRIAARTAIFAASLAVASVLVFLATQALPGDVAQWLLGENASPDAVAAKRTQLGLDRPAVERYAAWMGGLLVGDLGNSYVNGRPVGATVWPAFGVTIALVLPAMLIAVTAALPFGMFSAVKRRSWPGFAASALSQIGLAVPAFFAGMLLVIVVAVGWGWLPANGYVDFTRDPVGWLTHLILPWLSLAVVQASILSRYVRSATIEVLEEDWFRTARSVGWRTWGALWRHGLRNIAISVITVLALQLATLLVGAIVVEQVFQLPGLGQLLLTAVSRRDLIVVQSIVMILVACVLVINYLVDVAYVAIDPRLRGGER